MISNFLTKLFSPITGNETSNEPMQPMGCKTLTCNATDEERFNAHIALRKELEEKLGTDFGKYYVISELKKEYGVN
jgi:hypothetical protein